jgi:hypothetical protein
MLAWTAEQFAPKKKVPAQYEPPKNQVVLVLVDDLQHPVTYEPIKYKLTRGLNELLEAHKVAADTVPYDYLQQFRFSAEGYNAMGVAEIGQGVGADLVLHVQITDFSLRDNSVSDLWHGRMKVAVRWVHVRRQEKLWPRDRDALPLRDIEVPAETDPSPTYADTVAGKLADEAALRIGRLFYAHKPPEQPPRTDWSQYDDDL